MPLTATSCRSRSPKREWLRTLLIAGACAIAGGAPAYADHAGACHAAQTLRFGFYAYFSPLSYAADEDPDEPGFDTHLGYEADLVNALQTLSDAGLSFTRRGIAPWPGIWLRSVAQFDVVGGGITILESRTRDDAGQTVVRFTNGHVAFRQSLLVRAQDAARYPDHAALTSEVRVGVLAGTTGEARLLQLTGLADDAGNLTAGTRIETASAVLVADGSAAFRITASATTANLDGRRRLRPPDDEKPQVVYLGDVGGEQELLDALGAGSIDAVARGEIGNRDASAESGGRYAVTAIDPQAEYGGFTVNARNTELLACLNERIVWLTAAGAVGYGEWRDDASVFMRRAELWNGLLQDLENGEAVRDLATLLALPRDGLQVSAESSNPTLVHASIMDGNLILVVAGDSDESATITLSASQGDRETALSFAVAATLAPRAFLRGWRLSLDHADD